MELESKELLLKDLSARLPYGVMLNIKGQDGLKPFNFDEILYDIFLDGNYLSINNRGSGDNPGICEIKPYLRPMSSMTEGEAEEMFSVLYPTLKLMVVEIVNNRVRYYSEGWKVIFFNQIYSIKHLDFLLAHHFDFRGLIPLSLALEAPEEMY